VRELENIIERAIILSKNPERIDVDDFPATLSESALPNAVPQKLDEAMKVFAREHILQVLSSVSGDKKDAAKLLGMSLSSLYRKLEELDISFKRTDEPK
jgi:transcriptional regulator with PAS, ATPase and Fis domain